MGGKALARRGLTTRLGSRRPLERLERPKATVRVRLGGTPRSEPQPLPRHLRQRASSLINRPERNQRLHLAATPDPPGEERTPGASPTQSDRRLVRLKPPIDRPRTLRRSRSRVPRRRPHALLHLRRVALPLGSRRRPDRRVCHGSRVPRLPPRFRRRVQIKRLPVHTTLSLLPCLARDPGRNRLNPLIRGHPRPPNRRPPC